MGTRGTEWLESVGYNPAIVYPFGYVVDPSGAPERRVELSDEVRYVFVGRLDRGKNSALLLEAFLRTDFRECQLIIVGDGPERARLEKKVGKSEFGRNVSFRGILPNTEVRRILDCADCLVLPSRYDGWGAVVNEALLAGARAVVSDGCGAADVIDEGKNGFVFQSGDVESLVSAMTQIRDEGPLDPASKEELRRSAAVIGPEAVVEYFLDVVKFLQSGKEGIRPKPPWEKHRSGKEARVGDGTGVLQCQGIR
jgi:glycosyltransferase involved in cell wall biosynthesis